VLLGRLADLDEAVRAAHEPALELRDRGVRLRAVLLIECLRADCEPAVTLDRPAVPPEA
jgi:hypothetical protein